MAFESIQKMLNSTFLYYLNYLNNSQHKTDISTALINILLQLKHFGRSELDYNSIEFFGWHEWHVNRVPSMKRVHLYFVPSNSSSSITLIPFSSNLYLIIKGTKQNYIAVTINNFNLKSQIIYMLSFRRMISYFFKWLTYLKSKSVKDEHRTNSVLIFDWLRLYEAYSVVQSKLRVCQVSNIFLTTYIMKWTLDTGLHCTGSTK